MGAIEMKIWWPQDVRASRCDMWLDRRVVVLCVHAPCEGCLELGTDHPVIRGHEVRP